MAFNDSFLRAARNQPTTQTPVWFMRQAGRSLPGYRQLRKKYGVLQLTSNPELAAQVSLEPVELLGVDAAILFADIMLLPIAMGIDVRIVDAVGPVIDQPIRTPADMARLKPFEPPAVDYLAQTITLLRPELSVPLIGFSAAPFTLASYLIEGKPTRTWLETKRFMYTQPQLWHQLMETLTTATISYIGVQVRAGAQAIQIFDSWVGCLNPSDYRQYVQPYVRRIFASLKGQNVPRLHFGTDTAGILPEFANVDAEVIGIDWRQHLGRARSLIGGKAIQGNLDPAVLLGGHRLIEHAVNESFEAVGERTGYIFNLGHGVLPQTDDRHLKHLVEYVHAK